MMKCDRELLVKAILLSSLASGISHISNADISDNAVYTAIETARRMGVTVQIEGDTISVHGKGKYLSPKHTEIDIRGYDDILFLLAPIASGADTGISIVNIGEKSYINDYIESMKKYGMKILKDGDKINISPSTLSFESVMLSIDSRYLYDTVLVGSLYSNIKSIIYVRSNMYNTTLLLLEAMRYEYKKKNYIIVEKDLELSPIDIFVGKSANEVVKSVRSVKTNSMHFSSVRADGIAMEAIRELPRSEYDVEVKYLNNGYFPLADIDIVRIKNR